MTQQLLHRRCPRCGWAPSSYRELAQHPMLCPGPAEGGALARPSSSRPLPPTTAPAARAPRSAGPGPDLAVCRFWQDRTDGAGRYATVGVLIREHDGVAEVAAEAGGRNTTGRRRWVRAIVPAKDVEFPPWQRTQ